MDWHAIFGVARREDALPTLSVLTSILACLYVEERYSHEDFDGAARLAQDGELLERARAYGRKAASQDEVCRQIEQVRDDTLAAVYARTEKLLVQCNAREYDYLTPIIDEVLYRHTNDICRGSTDLTDTADIHVIRRDASPRNDASLATIATRVAEPWGVLCGVLPARPSVVALVQSTSHDIWTAKRNALAHVLHKLDASKAAMHTLDEILHSSNLDDPTVRIRATEDLYRVASAEFWYLFDSPVSVLVSFAAAYETRQERYMQQILTDAQTALGSVSIRTLTLDLATKLDALHPYKGLLPAPTDDQRRAKACAVMIRLWLRMHGPLPAYQGCATASDVLSRAGSCVIASDSGVSLAVHTFGTGHILTYTIHACTTDECRTVACDEMTDAAECIYQTIGATSAHVLIMEKSIKSKT